MYSFAFFFFFQYGGWFFRNRVDTFNNATNIYCASVMQSALFLKHKLLQADFSLVLYLRFC